MNNYYLKSLIVLALLSYKCSEKKPSREISSTNITMCTPAVSDSAWYQIDNKAPILEGLQVLNFPISTKNELAQQYFNQGLVLAYGFNHAEAARSFYYATKLDPECTMCYWGYAYVLGPNYNAGMDPGHYERAYNAIQKAVNLTIGITELEKGLIDAMAIRYSPSVAEGREGLDLAYADAMKNLHELYPKEANVGALYAEALMDLHPWDLYDKSGKAKSWTPPILEALTSVIDYAPNHPGAHHFYIHAVEASDHPEIGLQSAQLFDEGLVPGSGHLLHMPSHIYINTGDYHKGTLANIRSVIADSTYFTTCHAQGVYPLAYYPHNYHFMAATATLEGNSHWALLASQKVSNYISTILMKEPGWGTLQHYYVIPYYVNVKFGKWDELLALQVSDTTLHYPMAMMHYGHGMAYMGKGQLNLAKKELTELKKLASDEKMKEITIWEINSVYTLVQIASNLLEAEILAEEKNFDQSIQLMRQAVLLEDGLNYNEPPDWFFSIRHHLGAALIQAGQYEEAVKVYEDDLKKFKKNGWALHGLKVAYQKLNKNTSEMEQMLSKAWTNADVTLVSSSVWR